MREDGGGRRRVRRLGLRALALLVPAPAAALILLVAAGPKEAPPKDDVYRDVDRFVRVLQYIRKYYVDETDDAELMRAAIKRMLGELDPHTQFLEAERLRGLRTGTTGKYIGVGMEVSTRRGYPVVVSPMENTPAKRAGLRTGDLITEIDGADTFGMLLQDVAAALRGEAGTSVTVTVRREGEADPLSFDLARDTIRIPNLPVCSVVESDIGYIRVARYAAGTASELKTCLDDLKSNGVKGLILDLRGNPGGLLIEAVRTCELFVPEGKLIVLTKGRRSRETVEYVSKAGPAVSDLPLVVLVDGGTASAAEIVAGAVQDWDLGLILGEVTFGKGSVQRVVELGGDQALKLTTSYYYTPSGRCIHRRVDDGGSQTGGLSEKAGPGEGRPGGAEKRGPNGAEGREGAGEGAGAGVPGGGPNGGRSEFLTAGGRIVYGGGGITPDVIVPPAELPELARKVEGRGLFFSFAVEYAGEHPELSGSEATAPVMEAFKEFIVEEGVSFEQEEFEAASKFLAFGVRRELARRLAGDEAAALAAMEGDEQVKVAVRLLRGASGAEGLFREAKEYKGRSRRAAGSSEDLEMEARERKGGGR